MVVIGASSAGNLRDPLTLASPESPLGDFLQSTAHRFRNYSVHRTKYVFLLLPLRRDSFLPIIPSPRPASLFRLPVPFRLVISFPNLRRVGYNKP